VHGQAILRQDGLSTLLYLVAVAVAVRLEVAVAVDCYQAL